MQKNLNLVVLVLIQLCPKSKIALFYIVLGDDFMSAYTTKIALMNSLKKLMAEKPLNKITIGEIAINCGLNRQTFYYHFKDIYDLIAFMYEQEAILMLRKREGADLWRNGFLQLFQYIEENKKVCLCVFQSMEREQLKRFFYNDIHDIIKKTIYSAVENKFEISKKYGEFITGFYTLSLASLVESWLNDEIHLSPQEIVDFIDITVGDQIEGALERHAVVKPK
ncbi:MAG: TetR/AcrR family transcriptional regulator C-terminal domain-containing protein [Clostridiales bacterium]